MADPSMLFTDPTAAVAGSAYLHQRSVPARPGGVPEQPPTSPPAEHTEPRRFARRGILGAAGAAALGAGAGVALGVGVDREPAPAPSGPSPADAYPFYGEHQAGIVTPAQDRLHFAAFDVITDSREELIRLLQDWTAAAARLTQGAGAGPDGSTSGAYDAPPDDTGEAIGLPPSGLTITFGFGPSLFDKSGTDRFGLKERQPAALRRLPRFPGDALNPVSSDGDLCVQACAHDPQVAVHAIRNLVRIAFGRASVRWSQLGFGRTSSTSSSQTTPRNLFGFKDGTMNLKAEEPSQLDTHVWVGREEPATDWLVGGSYMVVRKINMTIEIWDRQSLREQEAVIGRTKAEGAPLSGGGEFSDINFAMTARDGAAMVPISSHVRLAHPDANDGVRLLRRGYNFVNGNDDLGHLDAGLFFIAFVRDPRTHFIPMQTKLSSADSLSEYLRHTGSALFAVPPGAMQGQFIGQYLFS